MTTVSKQDVPHVHYRVRRRRWEGVSWLLDHNDMYQLDDLGDAIWLACMETLTVEQITHRIEERFQLPLNEALAAVAVALGHFDSLGFLEWERRPTAESASDNPAPASRPRTAEHYEH